jgi:hypothetical protein
MAAWIRWDMMECGAGFTFDADTNLTGPEAIRFTFQSAAANGLTVVRAFGHGHDAFNSIVLQPRAGDALHFPLHATCRLPQAAGGLQKPHSK